MYIPARPPEQPRVDYPEPIQVSEPYHVRFNRLQYLVAAMNKGFEFADQSLKHVQDARDPQMRELAIANYSRQIDELEKMWKTIHVEVEALKNGEFYATNLSMENKKAMGTAAVTILIINAPELQMPFMKNMWGLWEEQLLAP